MELSIPNMVFKRSFKIKTLNDNKLLGKYIGDSPYQAANKALSEIMRLRQKNNESTDIVIRFKLVEVTKGSKQKEHLYDGTRIKLEEPISYTLSNGQQITKIFKNQLKKIKKCEILVTATNLDMVCI